MELAGHPSDRQHEPVLEFPVWTITYRSQQLLCQFNALDLVNVRIADVPGLVEDPSLVFAGHEEV